MTKEDVLDIAYKELMKSHNSSDVIKTMMLLNSFGLDYCIETSIEDYERISINKGMANYINQENSDLISYFKNEKIYFIDKEIWNNMVKTKGKDFVFEIDYSVMCDSNYASYFSRYLDKSLDDINIISTIEYIIESDFRFDYTIYLIENYFNNFRNTNDNLDSNAQIRFYWNLYNLELFKNIDVGKFRENKVIVYKISETEAKIRTDYLFNDLFNAAKAKVGFKVYEELYNISMLYIIEILIFRFKNKKSAQNKMNEFLETINSKIGMFMEREVKFAFDFFAAPSNYQMFDTIYIGMPKKKLLKEIKNIAWDFAIPRIMEKFFVYGTDSDYYVPILLTRDVNFKKIFKNFKVKGVLFDREKNYFVPFSDQFVVDYLLDNNCKINKDKFFSTEETSKRHDILEQNRTKNFSNIEIEISNLCQIIKVSE